MTSGGSASQVPTAAWNNPMLAWTLPATSLSALVKTSTKGTPQVCSHDTKSRSMRCGGNRESEISVALGRLAHAEEVLRLIVDWLHAHCATFAAGEAVALPEIPSYQPPWVEDSSGLWGPAVEEAAE